MLAGPVIGLAAAGYMRLMGWCRIPRQGHQGAVRAGDRLGILGVIGIWYPQLFGNGLDIAQDAFLGVGGFGLLFSCRAQAAGHGLCPGSGASAAVHPDAG